MANNPPVAPPRDEPRVISEWSIDTLYVHLSRIVEELDKRLSGVIEGRSQLVNTAIKSVEQSAQAALSASEKATTKAEASSEKRFEGTNEWRATVQDLIKDTVSRTEVDAKMLAVDKEMSGIVSRIDRIEAKGLGIQTGWGILVTVITLAAIIFGVVMALRGK